MQIKEIRMAKGISQRKAALDLGLSPVVYGRYENGIRKPEPEMLATIAAYLGVTVDELIGVSDTTGTKKEPAVAGGVRESVLQLFDEINAAGLSDAEADYLRAQIAGIKALRKA